MAGRLALRAVSKAFDSLQVLDGLSLAVGPGEALGVIGPNGAGKTTALNLMIGHLRPDRGRVELDGRDITSVPPHGRCRAGIALTHQIPQVFGGMTVFENVLVGAAYGRSARRQDAPAAAVDALRLTGLLSRADARAGSLPLLDRKRLELARALATGPRVLLLDEIAGGLVDREIQALIEVLRRLREQGLSIVWSEHVVHALGSVVDRLVAISGGRALVEGPPAAVMASPEVRRVYLGIDVE